MIKEIKDLYESKFKVLDKKFLSNQIIQEKIQTLTSSMAQLSEQLEIIVAALEFTTEVANGRRNNLKDKIEKIATEAISLIYGDEYSIELKYAIKNNRTCLDILVSKKIGADDKLIRGIDGFGGGVSDTISVPLRFMVLLNSEKTDRVLFLDEAYKMLDEERSYLVAEFLSEFAKKANMQLIICTHNKPAFLPVANQCIEVSLSGGNSVVKSSIV